MGQVSLGCLVRRLLELGESHVPARGVVVFGIEAFQRSLLKQQNHRDGLRTGLAVLDPCQRIAARVVEFFYTVAIVGEVGPAQVGQRTGCDKSTEIIESWRRRARGSRRVGSGSRRGRIGGDGRNAAAQRCAQYRQREFVILHARSPSRENTVNRLRADSSQERVAVNLRQSRSIRSLKEELGV